MRIDYACVFGISSGVSGVHDGLQLSLLDYDLTIHVFNGKAGKVFWFVIIKTTKQYAYADRPQFDREDGRKICEGLTSKKLDAALTFGDLWSKCDIFTITPLEEGWLSTWHFGRLVCMGDAVHKVGSSSWLLPTPPGICGSFVPIFFLVSLFIFRWKDGLTPCLGLGYSKYRAGRKHGY